MLPNASAYEGAGTVNQVIKRVNALAKVRVRGSMLSLFLPSGPMHIVWKILFLDIPNGDGLRAR